MTAPLFGTAAAILYFGWLWHNRSAADRREDGPSSRRAEELNRIVRSQSVKSKRKIEKRYDKPSKTLHAAGHVR
jgi:hypothetical protein